MAVATLSLTFSVDSGTDWRGTYTVNGKVNATDLDCYFDGGKCNIAPESGQIVAHQYGEIAKGASSCCPYHQISDVKNSDQLCAYYCNRTPGHEEFAYRFLEINPNDYFRTYPLITNRVTTASSGQCFTYHIDPDSGQLVDDPNGDKAATKWAYSNGTVNGSITIPTEYSGFDSTIYIYPGKQAPIAETATSCGPRCMMLWAYKAKSSLTPDEFEPQIAINCLITVSMVSNVTHDASTITDGTAKLAASAIALQGRHVNKPNNTRIWTQYSYYPYG